MTCYRKGGCGPYEYRSGYECPASKPEYADKHKESVMSYFDFMSELEIIAVEKDLRIFIQRASVGSGFFLYFKNDNNQARSPSITWLLGKEEPEKLFDRLRKLADEFNDATRLIVYTN